MLIRESNANRHWEFIRKIFRQVYLIRSFAKIPNGDRRNVKFMRVAIGILDDARRRQHLFLKKILSDGVFLRKILGIDRMGMCIRHPNQFITSSKHFVLTRESHDNFSTVVKSCPSCRIEASKEGSGHMQHDRPDAKDATELDTDDKILTQNEWIDFARFRILQVRSWENRFALKSHPIFRRYFKMLHVGVSKEAVKFAVKADGHHPSIIELAPNLPLELQIDQLGPDVQENLRSKGMLAKKEETLDNNLDFSNSSAEGNIHATMRRFLSVVRRQRLNQMCALSAMLDENEDPHKYNHNDSQEFTTSSNHGHHQNVDQLKIKVKECSTR